MKKTKATLFEDEIDDIFLKPPSKVDRTNVSNKPSIESYFQICFSLKKMNYFKYYFQLYDHYITCKEHPNTEEKAIMDISNAFIKKTFGTVINGVKHFGIKFIKKQNYEELYHTDEKVINAWFEVLKSYCILTKFRCYFESIKVIGKGNFAKVFLVRRLSDSKEFAVKVFSKSVIMQDPLEKKCLVYEVKMMRLMRHPRVLRLYELYEGENFIYCLCELYKGSDLLNAIVKKGSQPEQKALTITMQLLEGLEYMHSMRIIHRDLKPENIIFKNATDIDLGIVDLGFASHEEDYRKLFVRCGTPGYVAPEILNDKDYDCKVDVYSAGIILYIILTGRIPFNGNSYKQIVYKNMKGMINFDFKSFGIFVSNESKITSHGFTATNASKRAEPETK